MSAEFVLFMLVGFVAQLIDGALGMAYGVSSTTFLLSIGVPPVSASASVHAAQVFTTLVSGLSHLRLGNVDIALFKKLLLPGIVGGVAGAYILTSLPGKLIKPFVSVYLVMMGVLILRRAFRPREEETPVQSQLVPLAAVGGFMDAVGGGGWGPIVTSTIVARGYNPRLAIGSVNLAEFFVTFSQTLTFVFGLGLVYMDIILGLVVGGVAAAPLAAYMCQRLPTQKLMFIVGALIVALSVGNLLSML